MKHKAPAFLIILLFFLNSCGIQPHQKEEIRQELITIYTTDQELRKLFTPQISDERKSEILEDLKIDPKVFEEKKWSLIVAYDSLNLKKIKNIIDKHGYPGISMVGKDLSKVAFLVIQHSDIKTIETYYPIIKKAVEKKELNPYYLAMLTDRMRMYQNKTQIYGTQIAGRYYLNPTKKAYEWIEFVWPIQEPEKVNKLRESVHIKSSIEEYAASMGIDEPFRFSLQETLQMKSQNPE